MKIIPISFQVDKKLVLSILILLFIGFTALSVNFSMGFGLGNLEDRFTVCADISLYTQYFGIQNDMIIFSDFGFSNFFDVFLKFDYPLTPIIGVGTVFGSSFNGGGFFEKDGIFVNTGLAYFSDNYEVILNMKQYFNFEGKIGSYPLIQILCRFKIGEW